MAVGGGINSQFVSTKLKKRSLFFSFMNSSDTFLKTTCKQFPKKFPADESQASSFVFLSLDEIFCWNSVLSFTLWVQRSLWGKREKMICS